MLAYVDENSKRCRAGLLETYFGEKGNKDCGKCDVCRTKSPQEGPQSIAGKIEKILKEKGPMEYWDLVAALPTEEEETVKSTIRLLLDKKQLGRAGATQLQWMDQQSRSDIFDFFV